MQTADLPEAFRLLRKQASGLKDTTLSAIASLWGPYNILIATVMSARTKDDVTWPAAQRLFKLAASPKIMVKRSIREIQAAIKPVGFYRQKARYIHELSGQLLDGFDGKVPDTMQDLLNLKGVGRKTANLVLILAFDKPGICVDTHVHKIVNRWGYVKTHTPQETEFALRKKLPERYWKSINELLVRFGQNICTPTSPWCSRCAIRKYCDRVSVSRSR